LAGRRADKKGDDDADRIAQRGRIGNLRAVDTDNRA